MDTKYNPPDLSFMSLLDLLQMLKELKAAGYIEDREFINTVLIEISRRSNKDNNGLQI